jgi:hypothetical protein
MKVHHDHKQIPQEVRAEVDKQLESHMVELKHDIQQQMANMQLDLIRQFM